MNKVLVQRFSSEKIFGDPVELRGGGLVRPWPYPIPPDVDRSRLKQDILRRCDEVYCIYVLFICQ
jgi:hypothetical protein